METKFHSLGIRTKFTAGSEDDEGTDIGCSSLQDLNLSGYL